MIECQTNEKCRQTVEHQRPRPLHVKLLMQETGKRNQAALAHNHRDAVECRTYAYEEGLVVRIEPHHIKAVGRHVVRRAAESQQPEEADGPLKPQRRVDRKGHTGESRADKQLHDDNPPAFRLHEVEERTPQRFDDPRQIEPRGVEGNLAVGESQLHIHLDGQHSYGDIGQPLGEIKRGNPRPWACLSSCLQCLLRI